MHASKTAYRQIVQLIPLQVNDLDRSGSGEGPQRLGHPLGKALLEQGIRE